ncbi:TonB-dependent receptor [Sporocytophaga myxococcoides]|uniref:TonB-dependent receptor n=1 Tax=Sporocytophaga myxococcoides TaxID=153721 RepID=UPI000428986B|nr:TonB-dependent receptor [Sporocytophaga myxococcoides]
MSFSKILLTLSFIFTPLLFYGQSTSGTIKGAVVDSNGKPAAFTLAAIKETGKSTLTEADGTFKLEHPEGAYTLEVQMLDHEPILIKVQVKAGEITDVAQIKLIESDKHLKEVQIIGKSKAQEIKESSYNVNVVDLKTYANTTTDLNQILNRTSGIKVREEAGMGSNFNFTLNGFSGKQVKFFLDGVPMDNFGSSLTLNNIPANLAERIEVYKGVVPIWLGSDALGGAINVVTNQKVKSFADLSYSYGSFNTHRASLNSRFADSSGFMVNVNAFYNYSDNSYKTYVESADPITMKYGPEKSYKRFHDRYKSGTLQLEAGIVNKKFADKLLFGIIASGNNKEIQTGMNMQNVVGEAFTKSTSLMPTLKYKKDNLFIQGLSLSFYGSFNSTNSLNVDTSSRKYNWEGQIINSAMNTISGEIDEKTLFKFTDQNFLTTTNLSYKISERSSVGLTHTFNRFRRKGSDPIARFAIAFEDPNILRKHVLGAAYNYKSLNNRFTGTIFGKYFQQKVSTTDASGYDDNKVPVSKSKSYPGYGVAASYFLTSTLQIKASFEHAYRLPDELELMGNGITYKANMTIQPERSNNINLGFITNFKRGNHHIDFESGVIYRKAFDFIRPNASGGPTVTYMNEGEVTIKGIEGGFRYMYKSLFYITANGTYQDLRSTYKYFEDGAINFNRNDRIPNFPYLFGNSDIGVRFSDIFSKKDNISLNLGINYVNKFWLFWPKQGGRRGKFDIPGQFTQNIGVTYSFKNERYNISLECNNIGDVRVYDNFKLQKPGRAFYVKFRMQLHN